MGVNSYGSRSSKRIFINRPFWKGMNHKELISGEGQCKGIINYDMSSSGDTIFPRPSFINSLMYDNDNLVDLPQSIIVQSPNSGLKNIIAFDSFVSEENFLNDVVETRTTQVTGVYGLSVREIQSSISPQQTKKGTINITIENVIDYNTIEVRDTETEDIFTVSLIGIYTDDDSIKTKIQDFLVLLKNQFGNLKLGFDEMSDSTYAYLYTTKNTLNGDSTITYTHYLINAILLYSGILGIDSINEVYYHYDVLLSSYLLSNSNEYYFWEEVDSSTPHDEEIQVLNSNASEPLPVEVKEQEEGFVLKVNYVDNYNELPITDTKVFMASKKDTSNVFNDLDGVATVDIELGDITNLGHFKTGLSSLKAIDENIYDTESFLMEPMESTSIIRNPSREDTYIQILRKETEKIGYGHDVQNVEFPHVNMAWKNRIGFLGRVVDGGSVKYKGLIQIQWHPTEPMKIIITKPKEVNPATWNRQDPYSLAINVLDQNPYIFEDHVFTEETRYYMQPTITTCMVYDKNPELSDVSILKSFDKNTKCFIKPWVTIPDVSTEDFIKIEMRIKLDKDIEDDEGWFDLVLPSNTDKDLTNYTYRYNKARDLIYLENAIQKWNEDNPVKNFTKLAGRPVEVEMRSIYFDKTSIESFESDNIINVSFVGGGTTVKVLKEFDWNTLNLGRPPAYGIYSDMDTKATEKDTDRRSVYYTISDEMNITDDEIVISVPGGELVFPNSSNPYKLKNKYLRTDESVITDGQNDYRVFYQIDFEDYTDLYDDVMSYYYGAYTDPKDLVVEIPESLDTYTVGDLIKAVIGDEISYYFVETEFQPSDSPSYDPKNKFKFNYKIVPKTINTSDGGKLDYRVINSTTGESEENSIYPEDSGEYLVAYQNIHFELSVDTMGTTKEFSELYECEVVYDSDTYTSYSGSQIVMLSGKETIDSSKILETHNIHNATSIALFDKYIILYGEGIGNNSLQFLEYDDESFAPYPYGQINFDKEIIHVHNHRGSLYVFCDDGVWILHKGFTYEDLQKTFAYSGVKLDKAEKATVCSLGNNVFFMHNDIGFMLRSNINVESQADVYTVPITTPIGAIIEEPADYLRVRSQRGYGKLIDYDEKIKTAYNVYVDNNELYLFASYTYGSAGDVFLVTYIYDNDNNRWRIYDTMAAAYPLYILSSNNMKGFDMLCMNRLDNPYITNASYLSSAKIEGFYGNDLADVLAVTYHEGLWEPATEDYGVANKFSPIACEVDSGSLDLNPMHKKIVREIKVNLTNIEGEEINFKLYPYIDGHILAEGSYVEAIVNSEGDIEESVNLGSDTEIVEAETYHFITVGDQVIEGFTVPESAFTTTGKIIIDDNVRLVGKIPGFILTIPSSAGYKITHYGIIYRQRMVR